MIISRLFGGAGNQLFQYAAGRALADHLGTDLALDPRYVTSPTNRGDCFVHFQNARFITTDRLPPAKTDGALRYFLWRILGRNPRFHRETNLGFNSDFFDLPDQTYLHGYWQSGKYFESIADQIRKDLRFTTPLDKANADMAVQIAKAPCPLALHVRRGDYVVSGAYTACTPDYYRTAARHVAEITGNDPTCFVFSNDPAWARENLSLGFDTVIVDHNDETTGHFDLHLQTLCAHNVIANSTFSWWAAWLNDSPGKCVVAPKEWFAPGHAQNPDIYPASWHRL